MTSPLPPQTQTPDHADSKTGILSGLMIAISVNGIYIAMFSVAVPTIRDAFGLQADMAAWVAAVYQLPFMMFMPLYGRLGDAFGQRRLFLWGVIIFTIGTMMGALAPNLAWLMAGRAIQGIGAAGGVPLSLAIITQRFSAGERGKIMGTWNSVFPLTGIIGPYLGGLLIDYLSWRAIFWPIILLSAGSFIMIRQRIPGSNREPDPDFFRRFDWGGVILLCGFTTSLLFYLSSRPITGMAPLHDSRLLTITLVLLLAFIGWELRRAVPFIPLAIFRHATFTIASVCAGIRMFILNSMRFLVALYLVDIYGADAKIVGLVLTAHAIPLFIMLRIGGQLADRFGSRKPTIISLILQTLVMLYLAGLSEDVAIWIFAIGVLGQSLSAGLSLAPLHRASMIDIPASQTGIAAGLYSMIRFAGSVFGAALSGVLLQQGLDRGLLTITAYHSVFFFVGGISLLGALLAIKLKA